MFDQVKNNRSKSLRLRRRTGGYSVLPLAASIILPKKIAFIKSLFLLLLPRRERSGAAE
jgi:hypothetical protein